MPPLEPALPPNRDAPYVEQKRDGWTYGLTVCLLLAASAAIRCIHLTSKPFWFDECYSVELARIGWGNFLRLLWWREANMSLYYLLLRIWLYFGGSEFFIRSLSVMFSLATLPAIYWLARQLYDCRVGLVTAALFTLNMYSVRYAQEARSYALFLLLATLSSAFLVAFLRRSERRYRTGYFVCGVLAVYAHFYALLLLLAHWVALRWIARPRNDPERSTDTTLSWQFRSCSLRRVWRSIGLAVLPLLVFVAKTGAGPIRWIRRPGLHDLLDFFEHLAGGTSWPLPLICTAAIVAALSPLGKRLLARNQIWETWRCQFLLIWLFFPVVLTALLSFARPVFLGRYLIFCLPALLILMAAGLARIRPTWLFAISLAAVLLLSAQGVIFVYGHDFDNERDASGAATNFILDHAQSGDAIIFHIANTRVPYEFFRSIRAGANTASPQFHRQFGPEIVYPHHGEGLDYRDFTGKPTADLLRPELLGHARVWVMLMNNEPGKADPTTTMLTQTLPESFPMVQRWQFPLIEVRLYSKQ